MMIILAGANYNCKSIFINANYYNLSIKTWMFNKHYTLLLIDLNVLYNESHYTMENTLLIRDINKVYYMRVCTRIIINNN